MNKDLIKIIDLVAKKMPKIKNTELGCIISVPRIKGGDRYMIYIKDIIQIDPKLGTGYYGYKMLYEDKLYDIENCIIDNSEIIGQIYYNDLLKYLDILGMYYSLDVCGELVDGECNCMFGIFYLSKPLMEQSDEVYDKLYEFLIGLNK